MLSTLPPWEYLLKRILWAQLGTIRNKKILDFGSGTGITADHYAKDNDVVAIEPSAESIESRCTENAYQQFQGSTDILRTLPDSSFDIVFCHNVLEYAPDREDIVRELYRLLKPGGILSVVKHNPLGRVMQMVVLLNEFDRATNILNGSSDVASKYGEIKYYNVSDLTKWCDQLTIIKVSGIRTFWDLQQNQELHKDVMWQNKMIDMELRVADMEAFQNIAFFHHIRLTK